MSFEVRLNNFELSIYNELEALSVMALDAIETAEELTLSKRKLIALAQQKAALGAPPSELEAVQIELSKENRRQFRNIHSFIICCANISKLLWLKLDGRDEEFFENEKVDEVLLKTIKEKIVKIRSTLNLDSDQNSFHWKNKDLRNNLEHYNVKLIALISKTGNMSSFRTCHSSTLHQLANGTTDKSYMRTYVTDTKEYIFQGASYNLAKIESEVRSLLTNVQVEISKLFSPAASK